MKKNGRKLLAPPDFSPKRRLPWCPCLWSSATPDKLMKRIVKAGGRVNASDGFADAIGWG